MNASVHAVPPETKHEAGMPSKNGTQPQKRPGRIIEPLVHESPLLTCVHSQGAAIPACLR